MAIVQERQTRAVQFPGLSKDPEISFSSFGGYVGLGHFAVQQKLAQLCKSTQTEKEKERKILKMNF